MANVKDKKLSMADKMYNQNSKGGIGSSPKNYQNGKEKGELKMKYKQNGEGTGNGKGQGYSGSNKEGSFKGKYNQANPNGSIKGGYNQAHC